MVGRKGGAQEKCSHQLVTLSLMMSLSAPPGETMPMEVLSPRFSNDSVKHSLSRCPWLCTHLYDVPGGRPGQVVEVPGGELLGVLSHVNQVVGDALALVQGELCVSGAEGGKRQDNEQ